MDILKKIHREIVTLSSEDSFLVEDRTKEFFDYPMHYHPEMELNFVLNGKGVRRFIGDCMEEIDDIELVLVGPNLYHVWEQHNCTNKKVREVTIQFHSDLFGEAMMNRSVMRPIREMFERSSHGILFSKEVSLAMKNRLLRVSKMGGMDNFMELFSILYDLAISRNQRLLSTLTPEPPHFEHNNKIKKLYEFVQQNYARKITLTEAADLVNMSNVSFNRFIKKRTGKTFVDYLNEVRIGYASKFLIERDLAISEIAFICGFNSIANFNRVFKKNKKRTPTEYRDDFIGIKRVL
ncbi:helix-turn-helix transcriptional regulator [Maribacter polysiphoniae]|uniref:Helix-turn-helix protein n=1 Tax=Maribacter polysiphoniae TaxID=429344 RepID=A0A316DTT4_9FLAO|nr:AraC family transcriptional regulator [Maribacter polysiphoniae]MBD1262262.1 helix-turn-helix transcriptional regulator [Maribacter polysiphoniae]PWK21474.1 helix-turn-helix protein [Maribacter polysiphoniae]